MDINDSGYDLPPTPKRLRRKSKMSRPMALTLLGTGTIALLALGVWSVKKPVAVAPVDDTAMAVKIAQERVVAARTVQLELLMVMNPNPDSVDKAGLIQMAAIQRSNELREYINKLRGTAGGAYYNDTFELVVYKLTLINNQKLLDAVNGKVNQSWLIKNLDGSVEKQIPTATQMIQQCLDADLALKFVSLPQITRFTEEKVNELFKAQMQLFTVTVEALKEGGNHDAIEQFTRLQNEQAALKATSNANRGGKQ